MDRARNANGATVMDSNVTDCDNSNKMADTVNSNLSFILPDDTEIVILETEDGQQEVQLINTLTGETIEMDTEVAEQIKLHVANLSEDDVLEVSPDSDSEEIAQQQQNGIVFLAEDSDFIGAVSQEEESIIAVDKDCVPESDGSIYNYSNKQQHPVATSVSTVTGTVIPHSRSTAVEDSMPSLSLMEDCLSSGVIEEPLIRPAGGSVTCSKGGSTGDNCVVSEQTDVLASVCSLTLLTTSPVKASTAATKLILSPSKSSADVVTSGAVSSPLILPPPLAFPPPLRLAGDEVVLKSSSPQATESVPSVSVNSFAADGQSCGQSDVETNSAAGPKTSDGYDLIQTGSSLSAAEDDAVLSMTGAISAPSVDGANPAVSVAPPAITASAPGVTAEYSIKPCEDRSAADGFVKVVITRPDGERVTLSISSETLNAHRQPSAPATADRQSVQTSEKHQRKYQPTSTDAVEEPACSSSPIDRQPSSWQRRGRRACRRASRGVSRAVAALRRTQDSDASFSSDDGDITDSSTAAAVSRHNSARIVGQVTDRGRVDSAKRSAVDTTMFLCVKCSILFPSEAALKEHMAGVHVEAGSGVSGATGDLGQCGEESTLVSESAEIGINILVDKADEEVSLSEIERSEQPQSDIPSHCQSSNSDRIESNASTILPVAAKTTKAVSQRECKQSGRIQAVPLPPSARHLHQSSSSPARLTEIQSEPTLNVDIISVSEPASSGASGIVGVGEGDVEVEEECWECAECDAIFSLEHELREHNDSCHVPHVSSSSSDSDMFTDEDGSDAVDEAGGGMSGVRQKRSSARGRYRRVTAAAVVSAWQNMVGTDITAAATPGEAMRYCSVCDKRFSTVTALSDHVVRLHRARLVQEGTAFASGLTPVRRGKSEFTCSQCRMTYTSVKIYERHMRSHIVAATAGGSGLLAECEVLAEPVEMVPPAGAVRKKQAGGSGRSGRPCGSADSERQLVYDQIEVRADGTFGCRQCEFVARTKNQAFYHVSTKHVVLGGAQCEICHRSFYSDALLRNHVRSHTGERPFPCTTCGRAFRQNADLQSHIRSRHSNIRPFTCEVCGKSFSRRYSRTVHMRCHTDERNYPCPYCDKRFRASTYLTAHMRIHTGERSHACPICHKTFRLQSDIRRHIFVHSREKIPRNQRKSRFLTSANSGANSILPDIVENRAEDEEMKDAADVMGSAASLWSSAKTIFTYDDGTMLVTLDGNEENAVVVSSNSNDAML